MTKTLVNIQTRINEDYSLFSNVDATTYKELVDKFMQITLEELEHYEEKNGIKNQWNKLLESLKLQ